MISIAVCDDDKIYLNTVMRNLIKNVARICEIKVNVSFFVDGNSLLDEFLKGNLFDIVVLDIDMPSIDGKQLAQQLRLIDSSFYLVFMTSHEREIFNTLKYDFKTFISKGTDLQTQTNELVRVFSKFISESPIYEIITILRDGKTSVCKIPICNIAAFYLSDRNIYMKTTTEEVILQEKVFSKISGSYLSRGFFHTHRNCIVNIGKIKEICENEVILNTEDRLKLSKRCRKPLINALSEYIMFGVNN